MATPIGASAFVAALKKEGLRVVEVGNWRTHNRNHKGPWGPVHGVEIHHTVTSGSARTVEICRRGYSTLPGPLCHGVITKDGRVHLVGHGRANHAGAGDDDVLRAVIAERSPLPPANEANTDGNRHFYGFECENLGDGRDPWPAAQLEAIERAAAALCRHHGWKAESVIGHLEWQPGKVDPRGFSMNTMRARIRERLNHSPGWDRGEEDDMPTAREIAEQVLTLDGVIDAPWGSETNQSWQLNSVLTHLTKTALRTEAEVRAQGVTIRELAAALAARDGQVDVDALVARIESAIEGVRVELRVTETGEG